MSHSTIGMEENKMPNTYKEAIGKEFHFNEGDKVPQWLFEGGEMFFGTDVKVISEKKKVFIYTKVDLTDDKYVIKQVSGNPVQVCPTMHLYTRKPFGRKKGQ